MFRSHATIGAALCAASARYRKERTAAKKPTAPEDAVSRLEPAIQPSVPVPSSTRITIPPDPTPDDDLDPLVRVSAKLGTLGRDYLFPCLQGILRHAIGEFEFEGSFEAGHHGSCSDSRLSRPFGPTIVSRDYLLTTDAYRHPSRSSLEDFAAFLKEISSSMDDPQRRLVLGAYGAVAFDDGIVAYGEQLGLIMIDLRDGEVEIVNTPGFKPREF